MEQSATKRIAKNVSWLFAGNTINGILAFAMTIYIARTLGASSFGLFQFAQAFLAYLLLLVDSGLSILGTKEISTKKENAGSIALNFLSVRVLVGIILVIISIILLLFLPLSIEIRYLFIATFLFVFYRALNADWVFQGLEQMKYISFAKIFYTFLSFIYILILVKGPGDLIKVPLILTICGIISSLFFCGVLFKWFIKAKLQDFTPSLWTSYFIKALPLGASIMMMQIYTNLDTIMLGFMARSEDVGYYNAAYKIFFMMIGIFGIWQAAAIPVMNKRMSHDPVSARLFLEKYSHLTLIGFVPLILLVFLTAPQIISLAFGANYAPAGMALSILVWALLPTYLASNFGVMTLIPAGKYYEFLVAVTIGAGVNIVFNFILIPRFGFSGAAVATIIAETFVLLMLFYYSLRIMRIKLLANTLRPAMAMIVATLVFFILNHSAVFASLYLKTAIAAVGFILSYLAIILLAEKEFIFGFLNEIKRSSEAIQ
ncbi:MAG: flippase [bacterium]